MIGVVRALIAGLVLVAVAACGAAGDGVGVGTRLPPVELERLGGDGVLKLDSVDQVAVVNLWATWCAPCRRELPEFEEVHLERRPDVRFVGVNIGDRADAASRFLDEVGVTFENYLDVDGDLNAALRTATLPVTVVTDAAGRITVVHQGPMDATDLIREIERAAAG